MAVSTENKRMVSKRLSDARIRLLKLQPFYGTLLLHLRFSLAQCGTAATDMERIFFDPEFVMRLSDMEIDFVMMHEVMHCALEHCVRRNGRNSFIFNIAADIVVNSIIIKDMGAKTFYIDKEEVMHLAPDGKEGYEHNVEEVYEMLLDKYKVLIRDIEEVLAELKSIYGEGMDEHELWEEIAPYDSVAQEWKVYVGKALNECGKGASYIRQFLERTDKTSKLNWKIILHSFINELADRYDFSFQPPDRRFTDYILPSFNILDSELALENLWFLIDTSGSVSDEKMTDAYVEIKAAIEQFDYLSGKLSFFDTSVSEPVGFDSVASLKEITPVGGGGTSFYCIFKYMEECMLENLPKAVIILTDGYAPYPEEIVTLGIPVIWIISGDNEEDAPWGTTIHI